MNNYAIISIYKTVYPVEAQTNGLNCFPSFKTIPHEVLISYGYYNIGDPDDFDIRCKTYYDTRFIDSSDMDVQYNFEDDGYVLLQQDGLSDTGLKRVGTKLPYKTYIYDGQQFGRLFTDIEFTAEDDDSAKLLFALRDN